MQDEAGEMESMSPPSRETRSQQEVCDRLSGSGRIGRGFDELGVFELGFEV